MSVRPSKNETVPVGVLPATVAVKVIVTPPFDGSVPLVRAKVVVLGGEATPMVSVPGPLNRVSSLFYAIEAEEP